MRVQVSSSAYNLWQRKVSILIRILCAFCLFYTIKSFVRLFIGHELRKDYKRGRKLSFFLDKNKYCDIL